MRGQFVVFGYDQYYPGGGTEDILAVFDTREEAEAWLLEQRNPSRYESLPYETMYIADRLDDDDWRA